jgi:uncharacterized protein YehS (DUF1456 family)
MLDQERTARGVAPAGETGSKTFYYTTHCVPGVFLKNNEILRSVRYTLDLNDSKMMAIFGLGGLEANRAQVSAWLKKEDAPDFQSCNDTQLAVFLNGLIIDRRGKQDGPPPAPEKHLTNNMVFKKLRIALDLHSDDILEIMALARFYISQHEISSFFRKPEHKNYRLCKDQVLRNFLRGMQLKYRPEAPVADLDPEISA